MLTAYHYVKDDRLKAGPLGERHPVWVDLVDPSPDEERAVEKAFRINVPTREEMEEIEASSRIYGEGEVFFMTAMVPEDAESDHPRAMPVTFVLVRECLITIRYHKPATFTDFPDRAHEAGTDCSDASAILFALLENIVDSLADALERIGREVNDIGYDVFHPDNRRVRRRDISFQVILRRIWRKESAISQLQDSILTLHRVSLLLSQLARAKNLDDQRQRLRTLSRDLSSLEGHATQQLQKVVFMLDATLGMIGIEQSNIIKIVSVAALIFLPPTLIASVYGMNFTYMPELAWMGGYPMALLLMLGSAVLPALVFRRLGWI